ncbi:MAG: hypothetical protein JXM70_29560, partial [Pirellulales bacterium]|nr:hypothetical protein [Pirellulales bacterium]
LAAAEPKSIDEVAEIISDHIQPAIGLTRRYQTLQALLNCTRRSLLPSPDIDEATRQQWQLEVNRLEGMGVR